MKKPAPDSPVVPARVLVVDVGGTHVKVLATGEREPRRMDSSPELTAVQMVRGVRALTGDWAYDAVSVGVPAPVKAGKVMLEPRNLGKGWAGFDFAKAFGKPTQVVNDAAMQALGGYAGGKLLFLGLGTGLGSCLIVEGHLAPLELAHLPYRRGTFEDYVGLRGLEKYGKRRWRRLVADVVARLGAALEPDQIVLGGGNIKLLKEAPEGVRLGSNENAFEGGFALWKSPAERRAG